MAPVSMQVPDFPLLLASFFGLLIFGLVAWMFRRASGGMKQSGRTSHRFPISSRFDVLWQGEDGSTREIHARAKEISENGASFRSRVPLECGSMVYVEDRSHNLSGTARVRRCVRNRWKYTIGIEFRGLLLRRP